MKRYFNTEGRCRPDHHYMVSLDERLETIKEQFIDRGKYFVINRGRQYGKTTTLMALEEYLKLKLRPEEEYQYNSPWNIAADFDISMSFSAGQIQGMLEEYGRKFFLLYLKPIINGVGNYYIESQTRDAKRTDVIVDYLGEQYIVELKIWHGNEYNERGVKELQIADKIIVEAVV